MIELIIETDVIRDRVPLLEAALQRAKERGDATTAERLQPILDEGNRLIREAEPTLTDVIEWVGLYEAEAHTHPEHGLKDPH